MSPQLMSSVSAREGRKKSKSNSLVGEQGVTTYAEATEVVGISRGLKSARESKINALDAGLKASSSTDPTFSADLTSSAARGPTELCFNYFDVASWRPCRYRSTFTLSTSDTPVSTNRGKGEKESVE